MRSTTKPKRRYARRASLLDVATASPQLANPVPALQQQLEEAMRKIGELEEHNRTMAGHGRVQVSAANDSVQSIIRARDDALRTIAAGAENFNAGRFDARLSRHGERLHEVRLSADSVQAQLHSHARAIAEVSGEIKTLHATRTELDSPAFGAAVTRVLMNVLRPFVDRLAFVEGVIDRFAFGKDSGRGRLNAAEADRADAGIAGEGLALRPAVVALVDRYRHADETREEFMRAAIEQEGKARR